MNSRFTIDGSEELEDRLADSCRNVSSRVQEIIPAAQLKGLALGGGYGRGQGGVLKTNHGDAPYNDLEFYVFVRGNALLAEHRYQDALRALGEQLSPVMGLHVEFKIYSGEKLRRGEISMFTYDLVAGHKTIFGDENIFKGCEHHLEAGQIPSSEAVRLLFNRCSGLLLVRDILRDPNLTAERSDFIGRNLAKARLGFGDAILTLFGHYHWDCQERHKRLNKLKLLPPPWLAEICRHHEAGVSFKLHPHRSMDSKSELELQFAELNQLGYRIWLWLESQRLNYNFESARDYALARLPKCPETDPKRNVLLNLRTFGARTLLGDKLFRYPRELLFHALCLLLWDDNAINEPALMHRLRNNLRAKTDRWQDLITAYQGLWQNYG